jgi:DNA-binding response OmpR family regulator
MAKAISIVLYVEDEETDAILMEIAFTKEGLQGALRRVSSGQAAMDYISRIGSDTEREKYPSPAVVLLDLNLPEISGFDFLEWLRAHPVHSALPVVIFSSSGRTEDQARGHLLGANDYIIKPNSPRLFREVTRNLNERWLRPGEN